MSEKPLEMLPWGRTAEEQAKIDRKKQAGRNGGKGCLFYLVAFALFAVYVAGYENGRSYKPVVNESAVVSNHRTTEGNRNALR